MSDDEANPAKRPLSEEGEDDGDEEQIGPCIADAAPTKKRKGNNIWAWRYI